MPSKFETTLEGFVGTDPELRYTANGTPVCNFRVGVNVRGKDKQEETIWVKVTAWKDFAKELAEKVQKGMAVHLVGRIEAEAYADKMGQPKAALKLTAFNGRLVESQNKTSPEVKKAAADYQKAKTIEPEIVQDDFDLPF